MEQIHETNSYLPFAYLNCELSGLLSYILTELYSHKCCSWCLHDILSRRNGLPHFLYRMCGQHSEAIVATVEQFRFHVSPEWKTLDSGGVRCVKKNNIFHNLHCPTCHLYAHMICEKIICGMARNIHTPKPFGRSGYQNSWLLQYINVN